MLKIESGTRPPRHLISYIKLTPVWHRMVGPWTDTEWVMQRPRATVRREADDKRPRAFGLAPQQCDAVVS